MIKDIGVYSAVHNLSVVTKSHPISYFIFIDFGPRNGKTPSGLWLNKMNMIMLQMF